MTPNIHSFVSELRSACPKVKIFRDLLTLLAKGTDAGFYRLIPQVVLQVNTEKEVQSVIQLCRKHRFSLTFKSGGTSLSGQTITDSILVELGSGFNTSRISDNGEIASFGAAVIGENANRRLAPYSRKIGPSPASISSAKIGGIVSNNASGSSYGIIHNSYNTVRGMRLIMSDGSLLNTLDETSRREFKQTHTHLCTELMILCQKVKDNKVVSQKISQKFQLKNTCGYGVNSLIDFDDPVDVIQHLMIGSEGTLGFISEVTFETIHKAKLKAAALIFFPSIRQACEAIQPLRECSVSAAELMDRNALHAVEDLPGMPKMLKTLGNDVVALLVDTSADESETLDTQMREITAKLSHIPTIYPVEFTTDPKLYDTYWKVRKGLFTSAAATRSKGTACIIEDLAFRANILGDALVALQKLFVKYGYKKAVIWGHLLDGNIHFVIMPNFNHSKGVEEYRRFMADLVELTVDRFDGSLKAEHGTGRNMAPFVEREWGSEIYHIMKEVKMLLDPINILNPGVVINDDPDIFTKNLKPLPEANELIDRCIECGFCESECPSRNLTLTPRQRIVVYRELNVLQKEHKTSKAYYKSLLKGFSYKGDATCAADGLCERACPVGINTGKLIKELRWQHHGKMAHKVAYLLANHMESLTSILRFWLKIPHSLSKLTGYRFMESCTRLLFRISGRKFPLWTRHTPTATPQYSYKTVESTENQVPEVIYFPSCINRTMGISPDYEEKIALTKKMESLLVRAGYRIIYPENIHRLCCGMAFDSKGFKEQGKQKSKELEAALLLASDNGRIPILCDMSPCLYHMKEALDNRLKMYEPISFILKHMQGRLKFTKLPIQVAVHSTCSNTKMGLEEDLFLLASLCAEKVVVPDEVGCCAWAGDRGFFYPELNRSALMNLRSGTTGLKYGFSTSRTCEIGLSMNSSVTYQSIVYLVDKATQIP